MKELGQVTLHSTYQRTIGKDGKLGPCVSLQSEAEERKCNVAQMPVNVDILRAESKLYGRKSTNDNDLTAWQTKSRSKKYGTSSEEVKNVKRPKLEANERRDLIDRRNKSFNQ